MHPIKKNAHIAGVLYLLVVLIGPFVLIYVPGKLYVPGDATATAANILAHETLFRVNIVASLVVQLAFVAAVLALYRLLKDVHRELAALMVILILIDAPVALMSIGNDLATLTFVLDADFLSVFDKPQRDAVTSLLINFDQQRVYISEMFWGLWLLPLGVLIYRSGFLPRFLGVLLLANGLAYVGLSLIALTVPDYYDLALKIGTPVLFMEVLLMLWLLIVGARVKDSPVGTPQASYV